MNKKRKVYIIQKSVPHYRISFFNLLVDHDKIKERFDIFIVHGNSSITLNPKNTVYSKLRNVRFFRWKFYWQNCWKCLVNADVVIIEQANKLLFNYLIFGLKPFFGYKIAVWGHGFDHQKKKSSLTNKFKLLQSIFIDWWFAYTNGVKEYLIQSGVREKIITNVQNSLECGSMLKKPNNTSKDEKLIGLFVGSMYKAKGIRFLISACERIKQQLPQFEMIFVGDGEDAKLVEKFSSEKTWVKYMGKKIGAEKEYFFEKADILLIPQAIGLIVIESFNFQLPIITTSAMGHGPEFEYLENMKNSLVCQNHSFDAYANTVVTLATTNKLLQELREGCLESSKKYTLDNMVNNFSDGILKLLNENPTGS